MTKNLLILSPAEGSEAEKSRWRDVFDHSSALLSRHGFTLQSRSWNAPLPDNGFDLVMPLLAWGYHVAGNEWQAQVTAWEKAGRKIQNPPKILRWNADKSYLARLAAAGAPSVPARFVDQITEAEMLAAAEAFGTDRLVAKPRVSASAWRTIRWSPGQLINDGPTSTAIIQPYLSAIETEGEISLIYFGGRFSHAIRKRPQPGDFRVQPEYQGIITRHIPERDELEAAEAVLEAIGEPVLYARIDLVRGAERKPLLIEAELVEPDLYLGFDPNNAALFAEAVSNVANG